MEIKKAESKKIKQKDKSLLKERRKKKQLQKKKLIVRNLSFQISEEELKKIFEKFGEVLSVKIPLKADGKKRGFAFVQYKDSRSQIKAIKELNFKKIHGRPIAIDIALDKDTYLSKSQFQKTSEAKETHDESDESDESSESSESDEENEEKESDNEAVENKNDSNKDKANQMNHSFLKEFDVDKDSDVASEADEEDEASEEDEFSEESSDEEEKTEKVMNEAKPPKKQSNDVSEGKTVFIRNISFTSYEDDLQSALEAYGDVEYCRLCVDPDTDHPKGTAFVKFKEKESAEKLIAESETEKGIILDGRRLLCSLALSREEILKRNNTPAKNKDKRNLRLLNCGLIAFNSKEAEGVSESDMVKRRNLELVKKQKLKNVNFFVSDKRLAVHNIPKNLADNELRVMFLKAAGKGAVITEARILRNLKKVDPQGKPVSKGFGFVAFNDHQHALKALNHLNNNPHIFNPQTRPIVEFSVENTVALHSKEKRRERMLMKNKKMKEDKSKGEPVEQTANKILNNTATLNKRKRKRNIKKNKESYFEKNETHQKKQYSEGSPMQNISSSAKNNKRKRNHNRKLDTESSFTNKAHHQKQHVDESTTQNTSSPAKKKKIS